MTPELESAWKSVELAIMEYMFGCTNRIKETRFLIITECIRDEYVAEALRHYIRLEYIENGEQD